MKKFTKLIALFTALAAPVKAQDANVVFVDPEMKPMKGSAVSEFAWALESLDEICRLADDSNDAMKAVCALSGQAIYKDANEEAEDLCFDPRYLDDLPAEIPVCGLDRAMKIAEDLSNIFFRNFKGIGDNNGVPCEFNKDMVCYTLENPEKGKIVFAFPLFPA